MASNAEASGIVMDKKALKALMRRSDGPGLRYLAGWLALLLVSGGLVWLSLGTWWLVPAILVYAVCLTVPVYALSHECAHGTAFRSRALNEAVFWVTSLIYFEEPLHRRYAHASHHTHTWIVGSDAQMSATPLPLTLWGWIEEVLAFRLFWQQARMFVEHSLGRFSSTVRRVTPESDLTRMMWSTRACLAAYVGFGLASYFAGWVWPIFLLVIPRVIGGPAMNLFILMQHVEMQANQSSIVASTRSFRTNAVLRFLYFNMNYHIEHHLYPTVPFHALPELSAELEAQLPKPDPGFLRTNVEVLKIVVRRSLGRNDRSSVIRQASSVQEAPS